LVIAGNWLIASGITDAAQLEVTAAPSVIRLHLVKVPSKPVTPALSGATV
jgi:hypothetical protein